VHIPPIRNKLFAVAIAFVSLFASGWAHADPPLRAARLGYTEGQVSFSPAGEPDWVQSVVNRPLTTGDRLWVDARSRAELQIGGSAIRLGENTSVTLLNVDDNITQVQLTQGTLKLHVRRIDPNQIVEVDTPNLALTLHKAGDYRLDVSPNGDATEVSVQGGGEAEVYGDGASYVVRAGQGYRFFGTGLSDYESLAARVDDDLDRWARERERRIDASVSARYVSSELVGYEDLDANGTWRVDPTYGNVWSPSRVAAGWAPYHDGHWAWVNPWGWTWVDAAPWGYAVSHYGRWAHIRGAWAWVPGPTRERAVYAPALVVFLGGTQFQGNSVGWFPLAPREVYQPSYRASQGYFNHINRSNAVIAPATITNIYNTHVTNVTNVRNVTRITYVNRDVAGAVVAVPMHAFAQSQSVAKAAVPLPKDAALRATVAQVAAVVPVVQSVHGGAPDASAKPPGHERHVIARTAPPAQPLAFAAQQPQLATKPGAPAEDPRRGPPKPAAAADPSSQIKVVNHTQAPIASTVPPPVAPHHRKPEDEHKPEAAKVATPNAPTSPVPAIPAPAIAPPPKAVDVKADTTARRGEADRAAAASGQAEKAKADAARDAVAKAQTERAKTARDESVKADAAKTDAARAAAEKADADKSRAARDDALKAGAARQEAAKQESMKHEAARQEAAKQEAARQQEAGQAEAARAAAARAQADHAKIARDEAQRDRAAKEDAAHAAAARAQMEQAKAAREQEAARAKAARVEAPKPAAAPTPSPAPAPAPAQARPEPRHEHERGAKPAEKKDKAEDETKKH
jgi:hypothetical protein